MKAPSIFLILSGLVFACHHEVQSARPDVLDSMDQDESEEAFVYDPCGPGPTMIDEGLFAMFGCTFLNHAYKIKHNGVRVEGNFEVCGSKGHCIRWLEYECGDFLLCNDGEVDIIISKVTGFVNTHNKSHQIQDKYGFDLTLPLEIRPTDEPAPWNRP